DEIGTEICKAAVYGKVPGVGNFFEDVVKPQSPPQYTAFFDEKFYTDIKGYRESNYNYFYHIYAGSTSDVTFSVYMRAVDDLQQLIQGYPAIVIARSKRLGAGQFATENKPIVEREGYNQICVEVVSERFGRNVECGFGKVTTSFGLNYVLDDYVTGEVTGKGIKSEAECVPESKGYSVAGQGIIAGAAASGVGGLSTGLLQTGILRRCSAYNPGIGGGEDKWVPVGACGRDDKGRDLGTCWLYTANLNGLVQNKANIAEIEQGIMEIREEAKKKGLEALGVDIIEPAEARAILNEIEKKLDERRNELKKKEAASKEEIISPDEIKEMISNIVKVLDTSYDISQHARAYYLRGLMYEIVARHNFLKDVTRKG
ncbi:MAG: hypothetical protein AABW87_03755, partial [Nanoarchaeota archaeon]